MRRLYGAAASLRAWLIATGNQLNQLIVGTPLLCVTHAVLDLATSRVERGRVIPLFLGLITILVVWLLVLKSCGVSYTHVYV
mgnify:CR=1 FL=1